MSNSNMVAMDGSVQGKQSLPPFDGGNVENWIKMFTMYARSCKRAQQGLKERPVIAGRAQAAHDKAVEIWAERNDWCVSTIYLACTGNCEAVEIADQYLTEKEILDDDDDDKEPVAKELLNRLKVKFLPEKQDQLAIYQDGFTEFTLLPGEKVCSGVDRLNGIIQQLDKLGQPQTAEAKLAKLKKAIQIPSLKLLWVSVTMLPDATYQSIAKTCKNYDLAMVAEKKMSGGVPEAHMSRDGDRDTEKPRKVPYCSHCHRKGHLANKCDERIKEQRAARQKRITRKDTKEKGGQQPGSKEYSGCHSCGSPNHWAYQCEHSEPSEKSDRGRQRSPSPRRDPRPRRDNTEFIPNKKVRFGANRYVRKEEQSDDDNDYESCESHMFTEVYDEVCLTEDWSEQLVFLDSCAGEKLCLLKNQSCLEDFTHATGKIQTTKSGTEGLLETQGMGSYGDWKDITICNNAIKNLVGGGYLRAMGYGLSLLHVPKIVRLSDGEVVLVAEYAPGNGMPYVPIRDLLELPNIGYSAVMCTEVMLSDNVGINPLELIHMRTAHCAEGILIEGFKRMMFTGSGLTRSDITKKAARERKKHLCRGCALGKITRASFQQKPVEELHSLKFMEIVSADIHVFINCPDRLGNKYVVMFTDKATKWHWEFKLKERTGAEILRCVRQIVEVELPKFPGSNRWQRYHCDGGAELLDQTVKAYLLDKFGTKITWNTSHTPEQNGVSERLGRTIGERTLASLRGSGLDKSLWGDCWTTVCMITRMLPTRTHQGWMSPTECVPGGKVPNLSGLRVWGCRCYVLIPKADRRKDWEDKSKIGYYIGLSKTKIGYMVLIGDIILTSIHVLFDERIPERSAEYFKEFDSYIVRMDPEEKNVSDFVYLVGRYYIDEGLLYITTRVKIIDGLIVGFRALILAGTQQLEDKITVHIADVQEMTELLAKKQTGGVEDPEEPQEIIPETASDRVVPLPIINEPGVISGSEKTPVAELEIQEKRVREEPTEIVVSEKRARVRRELTNVAVLGEVHAVVAENQDFLKDADADMRTADQYEPAPETYEQSLKGPEKDYWKRARRNERHALEKKKVLAVVPIPRGVRPVKSKYVYTRKFNKEGTLKKYKARHIALGFGQVKGVDVHNTFAPVVKGITVRLLLALSFMLCMFVHQLDVSNAFCYADMEGDVYMEPTPDYDLPLGYCFKLLKALYGLRSSPRLWWRHLDRYIKSLHFTPCVLEPCLYHMMYKGTQMFLMIYVDDILIASTNLEHIKEIKAKFCMKFDMTDMGELEHFLNIRVTRTTDYLMMDQAVYAMKVLEKHAAYLGSPDKIRRHPMPADVMDQIKKEADDQEDVNQENQDWVNNFPYRALLGAILYLALNTRPDIAYAVGVLSRFASNPTLVTCKLVVYVMQYIRGTVQMGIKFSGSQFDMHIFTDADWAGDQLSRRSTTGYVVFAVGGCIAWQSKLQSTVSTSSMQSEYQAMYAGMIEIVWLRGVLREIGLFLVKATPFFIDAQSARDLAVNPVFHKRSKHIEIKYHWIREHVDPQGEYKTAVLTLVGTKHQSADIYTKALVGLTFDLHRDRNMGIKRVSSEIVKQVFGQKKRR